MLLASSCRASVESHGKQMAKGGIASIEKKRKSPPRDDNHKMADGSAPENDHQQMSSEGGKIGGPASIKKRKESPPRDPNHKMADGSAPENDLQQFTSEGGSSSVESHGKQMAKGGIASIEKKRKSPPRDPKYKMADGGAPENDHEQTSSEGGTASMKKKEESPARDANYKMGGRRCS